MRTVFILQLLDIQRLSKLNSAFRFCFIQLHALASRIASVQLQKAKRRLLLSDLQRLSRLNSAFRFCFLLEFFTILFKLTLQVHDDGHWIVTFNFETTYLRDEFSVLQ